MARIRKASAKDLEPASGNDAGHEWVPENFTNMVAEAAYYIALQRGLSPGFELADWLAAEAQIRAGLNRA